MIRVSSDHQDVARQRKDMKKLDARFPLTAVRTLELIGVSGTAVLDNEEVQQLLADLAKPDVDGLKVSSLDRLLRPKRFKTMEVFDHFVDNKKVIWSQQEGFVDPSTDEGYDVCFAAAAKAGAELRRFRQRTMDGRVEKLEQGVLDHSAAPYGYVYVNKYGIRPDSKVIDERTQYFALDLRPSSVPGLSKQEVARMIYGWARLRMEPYRISRMLEERGILSAGRWGQAPGAIKGDPGVWIEGGGWSQMTILQMLQNPTYKGQHERMGQTIACEPIIDPVLWDEVQEVIKARRGGGGRPAQAVEYLLGGKMFCERCERLLYSFPGKQKIGKRCPFYQCGNITYRPYKRICPASRIRLEVADRLVWGETWKLLTDPKRLHEIGTSYWKANAPATTSESELLQAELKHLEERIEATQEMVRQRAYDRAKGIAEIKADMKRAEVVRDTLRASRHIVTMPPVSELERAMADFADPENEPTDFQARRDILEAVLDFKVIYDDRQGWLTITGKVSLPAAESITSRDRNRSRGVDADCGFIPAIPFQIKVRAA